MTHGEKYEIFCVSHHFDILYFGKILIWKKDKLCIENVFLN